jgi:predicted PurR-regulated permease PerM
MLGILPVPAAQKAGGRARGRRHVARGDDVDTSWDFQRIVRAALIVAVVFLGVWMLWRLLPALAWAGVLAIATWPLRQWLARRGFGRTAIATVLTLVLAAVVVLPLVRLGVEAAHEGRAIGPQASDLFKNGFGPPPALLDHLPLVGDRLTAWWYDYLSGRSATDLLGALFGRVNTTNILGLTRALGTEVVSRLTILVFALLTLFFLYRDGQTVMEEGHVIADRLFGPPGGRLAKDAVAAVRATVNGLVLVGLAVGVLLGIAYAATGLASQAVLLGLITAVLATVPFGATVVFTLCALYLFAESHPKNAIALLVVGYLVTFVADHFVRPMLIGSSTRLPFLWVLLGIFAGIESFGLIGLFLGPAIIAVLLAIWREAAEPNPGDGISSASH